MVFWLPVCWAFIHRFLWNQFKYLMSAIQSNNSFVYTSLTKACNTHKLKKKRIHSVNNFKLPNKVLILKFVVKYSAVKFNLTFLYYQTFVYHLVLKFKRAIFVLPISSKRLTFHHQLTVTPHDLWKQTHCSRQTAEKVIKYNIFLSSACTVGQWHKLQWCQLMMESKPVWWKRHRKDHLFNLNCAH